MMDIDWGLVATATAAVLGSGGLGAGVTRLFTTRAQRQIKQVELDGQLAPGLIADVKSLHDRIDQRDGTIQFLRDEAEDCKRAREECDEKLAASNAENHIRQAQFLEILGALASEMVAMEMANGKQPSEMLRKARERISSTQAQPAYRASDTIPAPHEDDECDI